MQAPTSNSSRRAARDVEVHLGFSEQASKQSTLTLSTNPVYPRGKRMLVSFCRSSKVLGYSMGSMSPMAFPPMSNTRKIASVHFSHSLGSESGLAISSIKSDTVASWYCSQGGVGKGRGKKRGHEEHKSTPQKGANRENPSIHSVVALPDGERVILVRTLAFQERIKRVWAISSDCVSLAVRLHRHG